MKLDCIVKVECIRAAPAIITATLALGIFPVNISSCGVDACLVWGFEFISGCNLIRNEGWHQSHGAGVAAVLNAFWACRCYSCLNCFNLVTKDSF